MSNLTPTERQILSYLSEAFGRITADIASVAYPGMSTVNARKYSAMTRERLLDLEEQGYVAYLDKLKPICWVRTPAGTEALKEAEND